MVLSDLPAHGKLAAGALVVQRGDKAGLVERAPERGRLEAVSVGVHARGRFLAEDEGEAGLAHGLQTLHERDIAAVHALRREGLALGVLQRAHALGRVEPHEVAALVGQRVIQREVSGRSGVQRVQRGLPERLGAGEQIGVDLVGVGVHLVNGGAGQDVVELQREHLPPDLTELVLRVGNAG